jgi:hypothetical protein
MSTSLQEIPSDLRAVLSREQYPHHVVVYMVNVAVSEAVITDST